MTMTFVLKRIGVPTRSLSVLRVSGEEHESAKQCRKVGVAQWGCFALEKIEG